MTPHQSGADGGLGFIDIGLNEVVQSPRTNGKMCDRRDKFHKLNTKGDMPCILDWSLGYFSKRRISPIQLATETDDQGGKNVDELKDKIPGGASKKLPKSRKHESHEIEQQKAQDLKVKTIELESILLSTHKFFTGQKR